MELYLPLFFMAAMGLSMLIYVVLDGYDLGVGMLLPFATDEEKDQMVASIGPFWDANETWLVLGVGILLIAFPQAHGIVLTALYLPVTIMLMGLILRGVAFDFRVKAGADHKPLWNRLFFIGSLVTAMAQGWMLGSYITGLSLSMTNLLFSVLIALTLPALYIMLGSAWLNIKTDGVLQEKARRWLCMTVLPMGVGLILVSIATPIASPTISAKWFSLPNFLFLSPIPLISGIAYVMLMTMCMNPSAREKLPDWAAFACLVVICTMATLGLGYSIFPEIVIGQLNIWDAAAETGSLIVIFIGALLTLPAIIIYSIFIYRIFGGKSKGLSYGE